MSTTTTTTTPNTNNSYRSKNRKQHINIEKDDKRSENLTFKLYKQWKRMLLQAATSLDGAITTCLRDTQTSDKQIQAHADNPNARIRIRITKSSTHKSSVNTSSEWLRRDSQQKEKRKKEQNKLM